MTTIAMLNIWENLFPKPKPTGVTGAVSLLWEGTKMLTAGTAETVRAVFPDVLAGRTSLEKKLIVGMGCYGAWAVYNSGLCKHLPSVGDYVVPGFRWIKAKCGKVEVRVDEALRTRMTVMESRREGSTEAEMTAPKCQAQVGFFRDNKFFVVGACVRMTAGIDGHSYLVGPDHVLGDVTEKYAWGKQRYVSLHGRERIHLATDLVAIQMTDAEMSTIGVSIASLGAVPEMGSYASILGPESKGTTGRIINDPANFGRVIYYGTTLAGYSGSGYMSGNMLLGVHQMGGEFNGGYSATYAYICLKAALNQRLEESDEWLLGQMKAGRKIKWSNTGDPDDIQVCIGGKYSVVGRDAMTRAFGKEWHMTNEIEMASKSSYDDSVLESAVSGEAKSSKHLGVSSSLENTKDSLKPGHQALMKEFSRLSNSQAKEYLKLLRSLKGQQPSTSGQVSEAKSAN